MHYLTAFYRMTLHSSIRQRSHILAVHSPPGSPHARCTFLLTRARLSWPLSAVQSTLNSFTVLLSYRRLSYFEIGLYRPYAYSRIRGHNYNFPWHLWRVSGRLISYRVPNKTVCRLVCESATERAATGLSLLVNLDQRLIIAYRGL